MANRIESAIIRMREILATKPADVIQRLTATCDITINELVKYQELQSQAAASGVLSTDEAMIVYRGLGKSGQWPKRTDLASKLVITQLMLELLQAQVGKDHVHLTGVV